MSVLHHNRITLSGQKIAITFGFDPAIIAMVRTIDGRQWDGKKKHWTVPMENVDEVLAKLKPAGFHVAESVMQMKEGKERLIEELAEIKKNPPPYTGKLPLFEFQKTGAMFLRAMKDGALLGDVPGLGKTLQAIAALENNRHQVLVFAPATLKLNWKIEILKWLPEELVLVISGKKEERDEQWKMAKGPNAPRWVIANYELLLHDYDMIKDHEWPTIIADEATRISNPDAKTTRALKSLKAKRKIPMSGTPISNSPEDIYSLIDWISPGYLGTYYQFKQKYCIFDAYYGDKVVGYKDMEQLKKKVDRFMLRRVKEEVFTDFPAKTVERIEFELSTDEQRFYKSIKEILRDEIRLMGALDTRTLGIVPVKMLRLKQCTGHTKLVGGYGRGESTKLELLKSMLRPIVLSGEKAIVFTQFSSMLALMREELAEFRPVEVWGGCSEAERAVAVKEFNDDPNGRIILMTEAGAYGLNMQSASYVFHYDAPWSIAKLTQREDRAHRIGQKKPVTVYHLIAKGTIDEYVLKVLHKKQGMSSDILADAERLEEQALKLEDIEEILTP